MTLHEWLLIFPLLFMCHELEELAWMPEWFVRLKASPVKLPDKVRQITVSPRSFTLIVFEEFILVCCVILYSIVVSSFLVATALILVYGLHIVVHFGQMVYLRRYVPGSFTGGLTLIGCTLVLKQLLPQVEVGPLVIATVLMTVVVGANLVICHKWIR
ncbi:HXXEE domain-containing protein [Vagococcus sp. BWB3-3]|uniref:HXXEE domain-containing protein n=1 Tax=Vagococcus allomyrinae TaxID=2794353 RepID=A0A940PA39_9ENTE|nr:HXXEE domain-containing protein [Vagococcus allomyrinae]MBP1044554.1 HXXEE domain-containing protein [Vagococcus allomyrinae]